MLFPLPKGISYKWRRGSVPLGSLLGLVPKFIFDLIRGLFLRQVTASTLSSGHLDLESRLTGLYVSHPTGIAESTSDIWHFAVCNCLFSSDMKLAELREKSFVSMSWLSATASLSCNKTSTNKCFDMFRSKKIRLCCIWVSLLLKAWNVGGSTGNAPKMPVHRHVANEVQGGFPSLLNFISSTASTLAIQRCHDVTKQSVVLWFSKFSTLGANLDQHFQAVFCLAGKKGSGIQSKGRSALILMQLCEPHWRDHARVMGSPCVTKCHYVACHSCKI